MLAFRTPKITVQDLAGQLQTDKEYKLMSELGVLPDAAIPEIIRQSLFGMNKETLRHALGQELENAKQAAKQRLLQAGHDPKLVNEAADMAFSALQIEDQQVENVWKALNPGSAASAKSLHDAPG